MKSDDGKHECTYEVLDRLSERYELVHSKAQQCVSAHGASSDLSPRLRIAHRIDALRANLSTYRPALLDAMQRADAAIRALAADHSVRLNAPLVAPDSGTETGNGTGGSGGNGTGTEGSGATGSGTGTGTGGSGGTGSGTGTGGSGAVREKARRLEVLRAARLRDGGATREMRARAARAREALQANLDATPRILEAIANDTAALDDFADPYAICRKNAERAQRLQARILRVAEAHREITAWTNVQFGRLDMEIEAIERQEGIRDDTLMPRREE